MPSSLHALLQLVAALPHVEDPWPDSVGLDLPFSAAGAGGIFGNVVTMHRSQAAQARATARWGLLFFWLGTLGYLFLLLNQVLSAR